MRYLYKSKRSFYLLLIITTLVVGIASRKAPHLFTVFLAEYLGDTMWALLIFWIFGFIFIKKSSLTKAGLALLFAYGIEVSQLYHAVWIDTIRQTTLGSLILGHGFLWGDIICYTVGVLFGYLLELLFLKK